MQLDQISARIRRRTAWEGIDLGFAMARNWFLTLWGLWWLTALPVALLAAGLLHRSPTAAAFLVWWFKPLYEPLLLFWLSRRLFGEELSRREAIGEWRRVLLPRLLANLTLRRFSVNRSFYMPVSHLEGLRGDERRARLRVLRGNQSAGAWLTVGGAHFEFVLEFSFLLLALYMVPRELMPDGIWPVLTGDEPVIAWLGEAFALLAMSVVAPFYVAGGFALYITRRSELEAWDLELAFRRMAPRFRRAGSGAAVALLLACLLALPAPRGVAAEQCPPPAAQESDADPVEPIGELRPGAAVVSAQQAHDTVAQVLEEKDFGEKQQARYWKYIGKKKESAPKTDLDFGWVRYLAEFAEYALWVIGAVVLGWVLLYLLRLAEWLPRGRPAPAATAPTMLFGLAVTPESLPADVPAAVQALAGEGRLREALGLLYRATLVSLIHVHRLRIPASATEGECHEAVTARRPARESEFFARLTRAWVWCAWGHAPPARPEITALVDEWRHIYGATPDEQ